MKKIFPLLILVLILTSRIISAAPIEDNANLLSYEEMQSLERKIYSLETKHGIKIGIQTFNSIPGNIEATANRILDQNYTGANGGIVLVLAMNSREWQISTDSRMNSIISSNNGISYMSQSFLPLLSNNNYYLAFNEYLDGIDELVTYYEKNGSVYEEDEGLFSPIAAGFSGIFSLILGGMYNSSLKNSMSNVNPARGASSYLNRNSIKITENFDSFLFRNIRRQPKSSGNSSRSVSSSNHGGHGGGGGRF